MTFNFTEYGLFIGLSGITINGLIKRLDDILTEIFNVLKENNALDSNYCPVCGEIMNEPKKSNIENFTITLDEECISNINKIIDQENLEMENAPNNYLRGFLGSCIGGVVGAVIAIILIFLGYISALSAAVSAVLGSYLYIKFGGKKNKMMIVIVLLTTLIFMILTIVVTYIIVAGNAAKNEGLNMSYIDAFNICMQVDEFKSEFISNLIITILFSILGVSYQTINLFKMTKKQKNI